MARSAIARWLWVFGALAAAAGLSCGGPMSGFGPVETFAEEPSFRGRAHSSFEQMPVGVPRGRAIGALTEAQCREVLAANDVDVESTDAAGVAMPVRLLSPIDGIEVSHRAGSSVHSILDCRLVVALLSWSTELRRAGVTELLHYSVYRPGARVNGNGSRSGHASALAIDVGVVRLVDGTALVVDDVWLDRRRGVPPCPPPPTDNGAPEPAEQALLRHLVCDAVSRDLFQVVLTPHHDHAHRNHVHLELRPGVDWSHVR